ncbi:unnamed protein product [Clonostachys byssicola]|uniref:Clr5 domain-containing protein n=1 Tax=Clonostachys byssicola TaxID=160290 RepID=A0A9N9TW54_9HYPO|nr:unnamed protein product [Clonostachys byssicola]
MNHLPMLAPRLPGHSPPASLPPASKEHTELEWESKKSIIKHLYIDESRKLNEVMAILEKKHGFAATEQMFKKRLRKWNFRKRTYRKHSHATSPVTPLQREEEDDNAEDVPRVFVQETTALTCLQPSPLECHARLEVILGSVLSWSSEKLDTYQIQSDQMSKYLAHPNQPPIEDSRTLYRTFELFFDMWKYGKGNLAGLAARKGFYILEYVLTVDHPDLIWHMLDIIFDMIQKNHIQLLGMFLGHATALAEARLPKQHPLVRILHQLRKCDFQTEEGRQHATHVLRQAWLRNVDLLGDRVSSPPSDSLWLYEQLIWDARTNLRRESNLARKGEAMTNALEALALSRESEPGDESNASDSLRVAALMLEFAQMDLQNKEKAKELAVSLLESTQDSETCTGARFHAYARKMLARIQQGRCEWDLAEENLKMAIRKREAAHGTDIDIRVVRDMWVLADHYRRAGKPEVADLVIDDALSRAQRYLEGNDLTGVKEIGYTTL